MTQTKTILLTGATGNQGGAICRELVGGELNLRALTRKPESDAAKALAEKGVEIVQGDLDDGESLKAALAGVWGAYSVQNTWEAGVEKEEEQGKRFAHLAREAGVQHLVYSSVGSAERSTGIPHFDNKFRVEETLRSLGFPSLVIIRPVFFMENLISPWFLQEGKIMAALPPETKLQMIAVKDIGRIGARAFLDAKGMAGRELEIAGDSVTIPQAAAVISEAKGEEVPFQQLPIDAVRQQSEDFALMLEWFERVGYAANIPELDREFGAMTRLDEWARETLSR